MGDGPLRELYLMIKRFLHDCSGMGAAEYGLIIAIIGLGIGAAALAMGGNVAVAVDTGAQGIYDANTAPS